MIYIVVLYDIKAEEEIIDLYFESRASAKRYADCIEQEDDEIEGYAILSFKNGEEYVRTH